ncbi:hypothetical protein EUX98_g7445 [Antrodiella citrinella]|uniref:Apurinic-apyrimidinic endonuclease 1 n=1 Tax=Antrodiella citrinella TaxID=2447956 RepID=A0A4S4MLG9_9APHY|nr:hypothetical protein EUX98_g7445 [Antrodiella citrinella]
MSLRRSSRLSMTVHTERVNSTQTVSVTEAISRTTTIRRTSVSRHSEERSTFKRQLEEQDVEEGPKQKKQRRKKAEIVKPDDFPTRGESPWKVGPHVSAAGGVENTIINAASIGATAFALFVKSQRKWESKELTPASISTFKSRLAEFGYSPDHILPHGSYLVNLGNPDQEKRDKSYTCFLDDLKRCEQLGLVLYNFHPGSCLGQVTPEESCALIAECVNRAHEETDNIVIVLENMAGAGNIIGSTFEELKLVIDGVELKNRVGVCLDTWIRYTDEGGMEVSDPRILHTYASSTPPTSTTMKEFDRIIGVSYLRGMHLNDSKSTLGSKKDRHENIGLGELSLSTFAHILTDPRTQNIPLILETPAFDGPGSGLAEGMEVWAQEVEVLNRISAAADENNDRLGEVLSSSLGEWTKEIRDAVEGMRAKKEAKKEAKDGKRKKAQ